MITPANYPITVRRGDTGRWDFQIEDVDNTDPSNPIYTPIDISTWTIKAQAKYDQNTIWFDFDIIEENFALGKFYFRLNRKTSESLLPVGVFTNPDSSSYELQVSFESSPNVVEVATIMEGSFTVVRDLVRTDMDPNDPDRNEPPYVPNDPDNS